MRNRSGFTFTELVFAGAVFLVVILALVQFSIIMSDVNDTSRKALSMQSDCQNAVEWMLRGRVGTDDGIRAATSISIDPNNPSQISFLSQDGLTRVFRLEGTNLVYDDPVSNATEVLAGDVQNLVFSETSNIVTVTIECGLPAETRPMTMTIASSVHLRN